MRYKRLTEILRLATHLQGSLGGLTTADIQEEFSVSRRTAERMRDAVEATFGPLEAVDAETGDRRIRSRGLHPFIQISPDELADIEAAAGSLDNAERGERAGKLRDLAVKMRAASHRHSPRRVRQSPGEPHGGGRACHARRPEGTS